MDMYMEEILDHYKHPRNSGTLTDPTCTFHDSNPLCGDEVDVSLKIEGDRLKDVRFTSTGCAISVAAASMISIDLKDKKIEEVLQISNDEVIDMLGVSISATRVKCALLAIKAVQKALIKYQSEEKHE